MTYEKRVKFLVDFLYGAIILGGLFLLFKYGWDYISPFVVGFAVAFALKPLVNKINVYTKINRSICAVGCVAAFYILAIGALSMAGVQLFALARNLIYALPDFYTEEITPVLAALLDRLEETLISIDPALGDVLQEYTDQILGNMAGKITDLSVTALGRLSGIITQVPSFLIKTLVAVIASFFISVDYYGITFFIAKQLKPKQVQMLYQVEQYTKTALIKYIKSYSLIMFITFCELSVGLTLLGVNKSVVIAFLISVFDILPILGTGGILVPWRFISIVTGDIAFGAGIAIMYCIITVIRNIIEPKIIGDQVGLHPVATLAAIFIGTKLMGIVGLFLFPVSLAILKQLNDAGKIKLFK